MHLTSLFSNEFATIEADKQLKLIKVTWLQHTSHTDLREVLLKASAFSRAEELCNWLFDLRKLNFTTSVDKNWSANEFFPSFDLSLKHRIACIATPQNVELMTGSMVRDAIGENPELAGKIELEVFISMESGMQWLLKEKESGAGAVA